MRFTNLLVVVGAATLVILLYSVVRRAISGAEGMTIWQIILLVISAICILYPVCKQLFE